ncbi:MAG: tetratricopeptide repeat protein [Isosphaeraceae bacterium]
MATTPAIKEYSIAEQTSAPPILQEPPCLPLLPISRVPATTAPPVATILLGDPGVTDSREPPPIQPHDVGRALTQNIAASRCINESMYHSIACTVTHIGNLNFTLITNSLILSGFTRASLCNVPWHEGPGHPAAGDTPGSQVSGSPSQPDLAKEKSRGNTIDRIQLVDHAQSWPVNRSSDETVDPESSLPLMKDIIAVPVEASKRISDSLQTCIVAEQRPTVAHEPDMWFLPLRFFWAPIAFLVLGLGVMGSFLSLGWARDCSNAAIVSQRLLTGAAGAGKEKPLPGFVQPSRPSWWCTTAFHLSIWGVYCGRSCLMENPIETCRELLDSAIQISPISPTARLARAQLADHVQSGGDLVSHLGLSRDVTCLTWSARQLRLAGKKAAAIRLYRHALNLNCRTAKSGYAEIAYNSDSRVRRFFLPGEDVCLMILRELVGNSAVPYQQWSEVTSNNTLVTLAMAQLLHEQGRHEAQDLAMDILDSPEPIGPTRAERAIREATCAEAYALLSEWRKAERQYLLAIGHMDDLSVKRSWWFNLATIALQARDDVQRRSAIQAAMEAATSDEIGRRALELQRNSALIRRQNSHAPRAN